MLNKSCLMPGLLSALLGLTALGKADAGERAIPHPLPSHPGNIFLAGEPIHLPAPRADAEEWIIADYDEKTVAKGTVKDAVIEIGKLPVGYYEVSQKAGTNISRITLGVVETLRAPTPRSSPIDIDVALAWSYPKEQMDAVANLCQLAGMNRVRDRIYWGELEPQRGAMTTNRTRYDLALDAQSAADLDVLNVNHASAPWANPNGRHMPPDLRDIYNFYRGMARRWEGKILAFEPWNEGDYDTFGGHTGSEMATLQKAAYFGLKAGNPNLIVCLNVFGTHRQTTLRNFNDNKAWAYFDTFNLHHYQPFSEYPKVYEDFRAVSGGRPLWTTECNVTVPWTGDEKLQEPSEEDLRVQSERVPRVYAQAIHEGSVAVFYFMLPHYVERTIQYGVLHRDLTPRPAFLAVAAAGRLLADAAPLGRIDTGKATIEGYLFQAKPDGKTAKVLVVWSESGDELELPVSATFCCDHLGRAQPVKGRKLKLNRAPKYIVLSEDARIPVARPPEAAPYLPGKPTPIVIQALLPETDIVLKKSAYKIPASQTTEIPVYVYNFGTRKYQGQMSVTAPEGWSADMRPEVDVAPGDRKKLTLILTSPNEWDQAARVQIKGDFGDGNHPLLALRFTSKSD